MIPFEEAISIVEANVRPMPAEQVTLSHAAGRVLAMNVVADRDMPPHPLSAMDGFACRKSDLADTLDVIETIPAGYAPMKKVGPKQCSRIMTGAMVPDGADTVVMFEHAEDNGKTMRVHTGNQKANIRLRGEDMHAGDTVLKHGTLIGPAETAVLASVGCDPLSVAKRPRVAVIATGSELVEPYETPDNAQIRNSNSYQLCAQIARAGAIPEYIGIAVDTPEEIDNYVKRALGNADVVLLSGGVSMGDYDFVPQILKQNDIDLLFEKVAVKPGKPTVFGVCGGKFFFGCPGNPVSTFVMFEMFVRPFLHKLMGASGKHRKVMAKLAEPITRRNTKRHEFRPVFFNENGSMQSPEYHGSAHIHSYIHADGVIAMPVGVASLKEGSTVDVVLI